MTAFTKKLLRWYQAHGRKNLPWQKNQTAYRVWVSEIMLQQTQVSTVIDYYQRFMTSFPDVNTLATADQDQVLSHWAGLGYYSRARNLHKSAQIILEKFNAVFPSSLEDLVSLPGIGKSTAGAIRSFAFQQATPILDGNVKRVLTRFCAIEGFPGKPEIEKKLWQLAESFTPSNQFVSDYTQAIMDLGATLCTRTKPKCELCPVRADCLALKQNSVEKLPFKKPKKTIPTKQSYFIILLNHNNQVLLERRPELGIWGGLWSFPETEDLSQLPLRLNINANAIFQQLDPISHTFSHYKLLATPVIIRTQQQKTYCANLSNLTTWHCLSKDIEKGVPAPIKKLILKLQKNSLKTNDNQEQI